MANAVADQVIISYPKLWELEQRRTPARGLGGGLLWE